MLEVEGDTRTWQDVVAAARGWGDWAAVEERAAAVETALAKDDGSNNPTLRREVENRATEFRYERGLLSADETATWFESWGIALGDWLRHVRGGLLVERARRVQDEADPPLAAVWIEGVVSGTLERVAQRLANALAVHKAAGGELSPTLADLDAAVEAFERDAASPAGVEAAVAEHRLGWSVLEMLAVDLEDEGTAREVLYCVRDDGRAPEEVAGEAGVAVKRVRTTLEDLPRDVVARLSGARPGDVLGPIAQDGPWRVVYVLARVEPSAADARIAARARRHLVAEARRRESARRVRWLDPAAAPRA